MPPVNLKNRKNLKNKDQSIATSYISDGPQLKMQIMTGGQIRLVSDIMILVAHDCQYISLCKITLANCTSVTDGQTDHMLQ